MNLSQAWPLIKEVGKEYSNDNIPRLSAALAYYTIISLAPMLVLTVMILGLVYGQEAAQGKVDEQISEYVGSAPAEAMSQMIQAAGQQGASGIAIVGSVIVLLFGASGVFAELQSSMNTIYDVEQRREGGWKALVKARLLSISMVFGVAFLLLVSLVISTVLSVVMGKLAGGWSVLGFAADLVVSLAVITALFAAIFKVLPDVDIEWKDTLVGAVTTAVLFTLGKYLLSWYLSRGSTASAYGAAGSLAVLLIWVYYSSQILFVGAEFTQVYANRFGSRVRVEGDKARAKLGQDPGSAVEPSRAGKIGRGDEIGREEQIGDGRGRRSASRSREGRSARAIPAPASPLGGGPLGPRAAHRMTSVHLYQPDVPGASPEKIGALTTGAVLGGVAALAGLLLKRKITATERTADGVDARLDRIEQRIGSIRHLRVADAQDRIADHLRRIEQRILDDARAARKVETLSLKDRLIALMHPRPRA